MKRTIEIAASFTGTIPTGPYQNEKPLFYVKETIETDGSDQEWNDFDDDIIESRQKELHDMCYRQFKKQAETAYQEYIAKTYQNIRFYDGKDGQKYPSVTSIVGMDKDFNIPEDELAQYAARGTLIHKQVEIFLQNGEWKEPKDIAECSFEYLTVVKGSLGLDFENVDFRGFYKNYPFKVIDLEKESLNHEWKYGGRIDIICVIESANKGKWEKVEGVVYDVPTILDLKTSTTLDKRYGLTQQSAYAKSEDVQQIGLIHLNKEVKQGFSAPTITTNIDRYFNLFLHKRNQFKTRYGI